MSKRSRRHRLRRDFAKDISATGLARGVRCIQSMQRWMRIAVWVLVAVVPGGTCLLPLLIGDAILRRRRKVRVSRQSTPAPSSFLADTGRR